MSKREGGNGAPEVLSLPCSWDFKACCIVFGTAMGSCVSVTVANLVMEDVEKRAGNGRSTIQVLERYNDDTCTVLLADSVQVLGPPE